MQGDPLLKEALWFAEVHPTASLNRKIARDVFRVARQNRELGGQLSSLIMGMLETPPVSDGLLLFVRHMAAVLLRQHGVKDVDSVVHDLVEGITKGLPAAGLTVLVASARSGIPIDELGRLDAVVLDLHEEIENLGGRALGPREHGDIADKDAVTSSQWSGHVTDVCQSTTGHDVLVVIAGRSVGVGETVEVSRQLRVPILVARLDGLEDASCRLGPDDDLVGDHVCNASDNRISEIVAHRVARLGPHARASQAARFAAVAESHSFRRYLASRDRVADLPPRSVAALEDPYRFVGLGQVEKNFIADSLGALHESDRRNLDLLPPGVRSAYYASASSLWPAGRRELLSAGLSEMVLSASDRRPQRQPDWSDSLTWDRLKGALDSERGN